MSGTYITRSKEGFFLIKVTKSFTEGSYSVRVTPVSRGEDGVDVSKTTCLDIDISRTSSENSAEIDYLRFDERCSLFEPMKRGSGTHQMLMSTLSLCKKLFGVAKFFLSDASTFFCPSANDEVDLAYHNLFVYGESWYERKFNARPCSVQDSQKWENSKSLLKKKVSRDQGDRIKRMIEVIYKDDSEEREEYLDIVEQSVHDLTFIGMFDSINYPEGGCAFFTGRMMDLLTDMFEVPLIDRWYIPVSDDDASTYLVAYEKIDIE